MSFSRARSILFLSTFAFVAFGLFTYCAEPQTNEAIAYTATQGLKLEKDSKKALLNYARLVWDKKIDASEETTAVPELDAHRNPLIVTVFSEKGVLLNSHRVDDPTTGLRAKVRAGVEEVQRKNRSGRRGLDASGKFAPVYIHIQVVSYTGRFPNFGIKGLFDNKVYEPRVTGLIYELDGKRADLDPLTALYRNLNSKLSRQYLAKKIGIKPQLMPGNNKLWIEIYQVLHFGESRPTRKFAEYHRGHEEFHAEEVTNELLMERLKHIGTWYKNNVIDNEVTYQYGVNSEKYLNHKRTMVRSTMAVWVLNRLSTFLDDDDLRALGKQTMEYYHERYFNMKKSIAEGKIIPSSEPLKNGNLVEKRWTTAGFIASAALERKEYEKYKVEVDLLFDWLMLYLQDNGIFWTEYGQSQYFMPGQALLAISYIYEETKDKKYLDFFEKAFDAYEQPLISMMTLGNKRYAPFAPAWFTQPFAKMYELTKNNRYRDLVYMINDRVSQWYAMNADHELYFDYDGVLTPKAGFYGNNSITSASLESLADAAYVAKLDGDEERLKAYAKIVRQTTAYLLRLQYTPENSYYVRHRDRVLGGFKQDLVNNLVWCDNVWHLTSAFIKIYEHGLLDVTATKN